MLTANEKKALKILKTAAANSGLTQGTLALVENPTLVLGVAGVQHAARVIGRLESNGCIDQIDGGRDGLWAVR